MMMTVLRPLVRLNYSSQNSILIDATATATATAAKARQDGFVDPEPKLRPSQWTCENTLAWTATKRGYGVAEVTGIASTRFSNLRTFRCMSRNLTSTCRLLAKCYLSHKRNPVSCVSRKSKQKRLKNGMAKGGMGISKTARRPVCLSTWLAPFAAGVVGVAIAVDVAAVAALDVAGVMSNHCNCSWGGKWSAHHDSCKMRGEDDL